MILLCGAIAAVMASAVSVSSLALVGTLSQKAGPPRRTWYHSESLWRLRRAVSGVRASSRCQLISDSGGAMLLCSNAACSTQAPANTKLVELEERPYCSTSSASRSTESQRRAHVKGSMRRSRSQRSNTSSRVSE